MFKHYLPSLTSVIKFRVTAVPVQTSSYVPSAFATPTILSRKNGSRSTKTYSKAKRQRTGIILYKGKMYLLMSEIVELKRSVPILSLSDIWQ